MSRFERIVDIVDRHAGRAIDAGVHLLYSVIFLLLFAYFLHFVAITISERGDNVDLPGHSIDNSEHQGIKGNRAYPSVDRQVMEIQSIKC